MISVPTLKSLILCTYEFYVTLAINIMSFRQKYATTS